MATTVTGATPPFEALARLDAVRARAARSGLFAKQAAAPPPAALAALADVRPQAWADIRNLALLSLATGAGARGVVGLANVLRRNRDQAAPSVGPTALPLPYPVDPEDDPEALAAKRAGDGAPAPDPSFLEKYVLGAGASSKALVPWYPLGLAAAAGGGLYAGYKGLDWALDRHRKAEREAELEQARREFHDALLAQYDRPPGAKPAAPSLKVAADLDAAAEAFDGLAKRAWTFRDLGQGSAAAYGLYGGLSSILAGLLVYDRVSKSRSQRAVLEKAVRRHEAQRYARQPPEIYAVPEPVVRPRRPAFNQSEADLVKAPAGAGV